MTGIIAAMDAELIDIKNALENKQEQVIAGRTFYSGTIGSEQVVCVVCGIGKVNAAVCAEAMIMAYHPDRIINTGVGGAIGGHLRVCDVVCAEYLVQHDVDTTAIGDELGMVSTVNLIRFPMDETLGSELTAIMEKQGVSCKRGGIATGDRFVADYNTKAFIYTTFGCIACDMEGCAIAQACYLNNVPCAVLRAISDGADEGATMSYTEFMPKAAATSANVLLAYLRR